MKGGNNTRRLKDTLLVTFSISRTDTDCYSLNISYQREEDEDAIHMTRKKLTFSDKTRELAAQFTELLKPEIIALEESGDWCGESYYGDALTAIQTHSIKSIDHFRKTMIKVADKMHVRVQHIKPFRDYTVCCSVTPKLLEDNELGYQIRISYSSNNGSLPLSASSNTSFISPDLFAFSDSFSISLDDTNYPYLRYPNTVIISEELFGYTLHTIDCTNADKILYYLCKTAKKLGCGLNLVAFSGGPGWQYPEFNLRKYQV